MAADLGNDLDFGRYLFSDWRDPDLNSPGCILQSKLSLLSLNSTCLLILSLGDVKKWLLSLINGSWVTDPTLGGSVLLTALSEVGVSFPWMSFPHGLLWYRYLPLCTSSPIPVCQDLEFPSLIYTEHFLMGQIQNVLQGLTLLSICLKG